MDCTSHGELANNKIRNGRKNDFFLTTCTMSPLGHNSYFLDVLLRYSCKRVRKKFSNVCFFYFLLLLLLLNDHLVTTSTVLSEISAETLSTFAPVDLRHLL